MGRARHLSDAEKAAIDAFTESGFSPVAVADKLGRSPKCVRFYLKNKDKPFLERRGRKKSLSEYDKRRIVRAASNNSVSASQLKRNLCLNVSISTILRVLQSNPNLTHRKKKHCPRLSIENRQARFDWCLRHILYLEEWKKVIFSDEKRWSLDGPDGWATYWHDDRKEEQVFQTRQMGGGSVMVWGAIGYNEKPQLVFIKGNMRSSDYIEVLETSLLPFIHKMGIEEYTFQQDNAPVHTSVETKAWFREQQMQVLQWPARSPDLNIIENVWSMLSRMVYEGNKQYDNIQELKKAITRAWDNLPQEKIQKLFESIPSRLYKCLSRTGDVAAY
jgi:predicted transcriptional regulator